jgi:drug/metabolite transporter (DMT)-like permease
MNNLSICLLYGTVSVGYNLISKYLMSGLKFPPFFFLSCQSILVLFITLVIKLPLSIHDFFKIVPMTLFFIGNLAFGLIGMNFVSLPMYVCIRKLATMIVFCIDFNFKNKLCTFGVILITCGGLFAGFNDSTGTLFGYAIVFCSVLMNVGQLVYAKVLNEKGFSVKYVYCYSTCLGLPLALTSSYAYELITLSELNVNNTILLFIGCISSILASFMTVTCSGKVSPIATSITGNFKDAFSMLLGLFLFQEDFTDLFLIGLLISTFGAALFSYSKLNSLNLKLS